jgi:hypothetical protein
LDIEGMGDRFWRFMENLGARRRTDAEMLANFSETPPVFGAQTGAQSPATVPAQVLNSIAADYNRFRPERISRAWVISLGVLFFVYLITCGVPRLFDQIDGQYAGAAREMTVRNHWLIPTQNGVPRLQKPPLVYWCEIVSMRALGVTEFAARLPVALATVGWFVGTALIAWRSVGTLSAGLAGALTLAMSTGTFFFAHLVMPEPFLCCFLTFAFWSFLMALEADSLPERKRVANQWLLAAWLFIALGTLAKGIHAILIPVTAFSFAALLKPSIRSLWRRFLLRPHARARKRGTGQIGRECKKRRDGTGVADANY